MTWIETMLTPAFECRFPGKKMCLVLDNAPYHHAHPSSEEGYIDVKSLTKEKCVFWMHALGLNSISAIRTTVTKVAAASSNPQVVPPTPTPPATPGPVVPATPTRFATPGSLPAVPATPVPAPALPVVVAPVTSVKTTTTPEKEETTTTVKTATSITVVQEIVWNAVASGWLPTSVDPQAKPTRVPNFPNGPSTEEMSAVLVAHAELHHPEVCPYTASNTNRLSSCARGSQPFSTTRDGL